MDNPTTALAVDALAGRILDRRYAIGAPIARGGMATVYLAVDQRLDRQVAVKVMLSAFAHDPDFVRRFEREAKAAARISDPNVVAVHDTGTDGEGADRVVYLVMEYVRGQTLRELLATRGRPSPYRAHVIFEPMLLALAAAHRAGLVHRDVKPENVLLSDEGAVKVADFGLVRSVDESGLTGPVILGTAAYLAPEQVRAGGTDVGPATDVYAAGICLFEMLAGRTPYAGEDPRAVAYRRLHEGVPPVSDLVPGLPASIDVLVARATATEPGDRYADAAEFVAAVREVRRNLPTPPPAVRARGGDTAAIPLDEHFTQVLPPATSNAPSVPTTQTSPTRAVPAQQRPPTSKATKRRRLIAALVVLFVLFCAAVAGAGWWFGSGRYVKVPHVAGLTTAQAASALHSHHLDALTGPPEHSDSVAAGLVADGSPHQGKRLTRGSNVTLHISQGVLKVPVPAVTAKPLATARALLAQAGLTVGTTSNDYSDTVPTGSVISSTPATGVALDHRTPVTLSVSQGPAPVTLPSLVTLTQPAAIAELNGLGLKNSLTADFSDTVHAGFVISQNPPGKSTVHRGDTIALVISKGPQLVSVPIYRGESASAAAQALTTAGLVPDEHDLLGIPGNVVAFSPSGKVKPGTVVTFWTA